MNSGWEVHDTVTGVHCFPVDDLIVHFDSEWCTCAPKIQTKGTTCWGHGPMGNLAVKKVYVHEAMDGRE